MKTSRKWLQNYFEQSLPNTDEIADALTFHAFEIEESDGDMMDVNVLPNRAADCLCHRGIAKELSAILNISLKNDSLRESIPAFQKTSELSVEIEDPKKCSRYIGALVKNVKVGPSPDWLREALESIGQRSINNIVDATNYVMLNIGQPLHAFDAKKLSGKIEVRLAQQGEEIDLLKTYVTAKGDIPAGLNRRIVFGGGELIIADAKHGPLVLAGIKGGKLAEISDNTTDIIIEAANFDGTIVRRLSRYFGLQTESSLRFQNRPSPELCAYGMRDVLTLITEIAGGEVVGIVDEYPTKQKNAPVSVSTNKINQILGSDFSSEEIGDVFKRLGFETKTENDIFTIIPPFERTDLTIPENFAEEVGRIIGYDKIIPTELPSLGEEPDQARYRGIEKVKDFLVEHGFTEISTQSFAKKGDVYLANPLDKTRPALHKDLKENMQEALMKAKQYAPLVFAPNQKPKLFEIGTIFKKEGEEVEIQTSEPVSDLPDIKDDNNYVPAQYELSAYKPFSAYPFITRDISMWIPEPAQQRDTLAVLSPIVKKYAPAPDFFTPILYGSYDQYTDPKTSRISQKFSIAFQSFSRTLTDDEVNKIMQKITIALTEKGYEVR
jgi:phenylalanyl-tRNA synthetase beta chain